MRCSEEVQKRIDQRMKDTVRQAEEAMLRAEEVRRRIEVGDVQLQEEGVRGLIEQSSP